MNMKKIVGAIVSISVSVILIGTMLAPQIAEYTKTGGALAQYSGILSAVVIVAVVAVMMIAVRLISTGRD